MKKLVVLMLVAAVCLPGYGCAAVNVAHGVFMGGFIAKRLLLDGNSRGAGKPDKGKTELAKKLD